MNIYHRGAHDGLLMGAFLSALFLMQVLGARVPLLGLLGTLMMLAVPVLAYAMVTKVYRQCRCLSPFSALWMHGILIFLCGSLILGLVMLVYMRFVDPSYITDQLRQSMQALSQVGSEAAREMAGVLQKMLDNPRTIPTAVQVAFAAIWAGGFFGAVTAMIIAGIVKYFVKSKG